MWPFVLEWQHFHVAGRNFEKIFQHLKKYRKICNSLNVMALSGRESSLVQSSLESCVRFDFTHSFVHMARRFVTQGCPTISPGMCAFTAVFEAYTNCTLLVPRVGVFCLWR